MTGDGAERALEDVDLFPLPGDEPPTSTRWSTAAFAEELRGWVEGHLGPAELVQTKLRGWSTVWRADTAAGVFWAKQNCRGGAYEAALLATIARLAPDRVVGVVAADPVQGLLLTADGGTTLGHRGGVAGWSRLVGEYAGLQRALLGHTGALLATGVPVLRPLDAPALVSERADALHSLPEEDPRHLDAEARRALQRALPAVRASADAVTGLGLPLVLNHNDLHGDNAFGAPADGHLRFFDFGDAMLTDPLSVLLVPLRSAQVDLGCRSDDPRLWRVADAWIEHWSDLAPARDLRAALPHALRLAGLWRHESWIRVLAAHDREQLAEWGEAGPRWLRSVVDPPVLDWVG